jgi:hypothetical protein
VAFVSSIDGNDGAPLCTGDLIRLVGFCFSPELEDHRVVFSAGVGSVDGLLVAVSRQPPSGGSNLIPSTLDVLVPAGMTSGNLELFVNGQSAGGVGVEGCPSLLAFTLAANESDPFLQYTILGFTQGASRINLYGLNLDDALEVLVDDGSGNAARIPANTFIRTPPAGTVGSGFAGLDFLGFNLRDADNDVRFPFTGERSNLGVTVRGPGGDSNRLEIPVSTNAAPAVIGAVVSGVLVPSGVVTGPVRFHYSLYELEVDAAWTMEFEFSVDGGSTWFSAKPRDTDPENDGKFRIICGTVQHFSRHALLPSRGGFRTFVWDAQCDPNFRLLNNDIDQGRPVGRNWVVKFRLIPMPETTNRNFINHVVETPDILYFDLEDRPQDLVARSREREFVESFSDDRNEDIAHTRARWGPPFNAGSLTGEIEGQLNRFGDDGTAVLELGPRDIPIGVPDTASQRYLIDTSRATIVHQFLAPDPNNANALEVVAEQVVGLVDDTGRSVPNPGQAAHEFHVARLTVEQNAVVRAIGDFPLVFRVAGVGDNPPDDEEVVDIAGTLDLRGEDGGDGGFPTFGAGGRGGPGAGAGGRGAFLALEPVGSRVRILVNSEPGRSGASENCTNSQDDDGDGLADLLDLDCAPAGAAGETAAAVHFDMTRATSLLAGGPGGGGGHRFAGGRGEYGTNNISQYSPPRSGEGGPARGDALQVPLTTGSGGGGGGATLSRVQVMMVPTSAPTGGAGGGGGGGGLKIVARGSIRVRATGSINADGGEGGTGNTTPGPNVGAAPAGIAPGGAGGGGSGGSIVLQATGEVDVGNCSSLRVEGGRGGVGGTGNSQNATAGAGAGSPGFIRIESGTGGAPFCGTLVASTQLTAMVGDGSRPARMENLQASVGSTADFPERGVVIIDNEEIGYALKNPTALVGLTRGLNGTTPAIHNPPAVVRYKGSIVPGESGALVNNGITVSPEPVEVGLGRDGVLHLRFEEPSIDPLTGQPLIDPDTGRELSVWTFNTDTSTLMTPSGQDFLTTRAAVTRPGLLDLVGLRVDEDVVLRAVGSNPLQILVRDFAEVSGALSVDGGDGGPLRFVGDGTAPLPGLDGTPGAGGGSGGLGGTIQFVGVPPQLNPDSAVTVPIDGQAGGTPAAVQPFLSPEFGGSGDPQNLLVGPGFRPSEGGSSHPGRACALGCLETAGGGGGGGRLQAGEAGSAVADPANNDPNRVAELAGEASSVFALSSFRFGGGFFLAGGMGGAGGGASANVSGFYRGAGIQGQYPFKARALYGPGTGGGAGGGVLFLVAENLILRPGARLLARGGDAYQSIDLAGNGGAGGGGAIFVRVSNSLTIDPSAVIDVSGGTANLIPPIGPAGLALYEGNIRPTPNGPPSLRGTDFGGHGGNGGSGIIRIETPFDSSLAARGVNTRVVTGTFLRDAGESVGTSRVVRLGLASGRVATSPRMRFDVARVLFNSAQQPPDTDVVVLWDSARQSLNFHGRAGSFSGGVRDPRTLADRDFVRFRAFFLPNLVNRTSQSIEEIRLPYSLNPAECIDNP